MLNRTNTVVGLAFTAGLGLICALAVTAGANLAQADQPAASASPNGPAQGGSGSAAENKPTGGTSNVVPSDVTTKEQNGIDAEGKALVPTHCNHMLNLPILVPRMVYDLHDYCGGEIALF